MPGLTDTVQLISLERTKASITEDCTQADFAEVKYRPVRPDTCICHRMYEKMTLLQVQFREVTLGPTAASVSRDIISFCHSLFSLCSFW